MKMTEKQIEKVSALILNGLHKSEFLTVVKKDEDIRRVIKDVITKNIRDEALLDQEVKKLMETYSSQIEKGEMDSRKVFSMIKTKLAKEKQFVL